jgi:hypothetical protein
MRKHLTYANVMSTLAALFALSGGVAYAANTVFSSDIVDGEVKAADIATSAVGEAEIGQGAVATSELKNDAVTSPKVLNGTLVGGDVADNALKGADIDESTLSNIGGGQAGGDLTGTYPNPQVGSNAVGSAEVIDGSLNDEDIGLSFANFAANIGIVIAGQCSERTITGIDVAGDHLLLTPDFNTQSGRLIYSAEYFASDQAMEIQACNPTDSDVEDGDTNFNLLAIDAQ